MSDGGRMVSEDVPADDGGVSSPPPNTFAIVAPACYVATLGLGTKRGTIRRSEALTRNYDISLSTWVPRMWLCW